MREADKHTPSSLSGIIFSFVLLLGGWWLSLQQGWFVWGIVMMGMFLVILIKKLLGFLKFAFHTKEQIDLLHESRTVSDEYGNARLACEDDAFVKKLSKNIKGFYIGTLGKIPLFYDPFQSGNGHMLTYAPARTGKTICVVIPALMHWFFGSMFVMDVKGELTAITARFREFMGHRILKFNPFDVLGIKGMSFNPLRVLVDDIMHNQGRELSNLARLIAFQLVAERENDMGDGVFFRNGARRLIIALLLYMAVFKPGKCHLPALRKLVWSSNAEKEIIAAKMQSCDLFSGLLQDYGNALSDMLLPEYIKTYGAFRDNAMSALEIYEEHSPLGKAMMESDFSVSDLLNSKTTLYFILPESKIETHGSAAGLFSTLLIEAVASLKKPTRLMMLMDEMGNLGRLPNLSKALSLLPGKGLRLWMVFQSRRQPIEIYGPQKAGLIEEQASLIQQWSIRSELDRKAWSARIGNTTKKARSLNRDPDDPHSPWRLGIGERSAPVKSPDEIGRMNTDQQLTAIDGQSVIKCKKLAHFQIEPWRSRAEKSPYHEGEYPKDLPVRHWLEKRS